MTETVPTLFIEPGKYHVMLSGYDLAFDVVLSPAEALFVLMFLSSESDTLEDWDEPEQARKSIETALRRMKIARKVAVCYAVDHGLLNLPDEAKALVGRAWVKFKETAARDHLTQATLEFLREGP